MNVASSRWHRSCRTPRAVGGTLESVSVTHRIQDLPHTPETGRLRSSPTPPDHRSWRPNAEHPGLRDEGRPEPAYLGLPAAPAALPAPPPPTVRNAWRVPPLCVVWPSCRRSHSASTDGGPMQRTGQKQGRCCLQKVWDNCVGSTARLVSSVALSDRSDCNSCGSDTLLSANFALGTPFRTDDSPDIRVQRLAVRPLISNLLKARRPVPPGDLPQRQPASELYYPGRRFDSPRQAAALRWHSRDAWSVWAESLIGAVSGHQSWALLCRVRCRLLLAEIPKVVDRNSELKQRLQLWKIGTNQRSDLQGPGQQSSGPPRRTARGMQPQTDEQRGKRACLGRRHAGLGRLPQKLDYSSHPPELGHWNSSLQCAECAEAARIAWGGGRYMLARSAMREQGRCKTGIASLPHVKRSPISALCLAGERQEHLDAIVSGS